MLALRLHGLGSAWTTLHLLREREMGELLGIPDTETQAGMFPVVYTVGTDFKPADRARLGRPRPLEPLVKSIDPGVSRNCRFRFPTGRWTSGPRRASPVCATSSRPPTTSTTGYATRSVTDPSLRRAYVRSIFPPLSTRVCSTTSWTIDGDARALRPD